MAPGKPRFHPHGGEFHPSRWSKPPKTLYDIGEQDGIHYLVMEHLVGKTLSARLEKGALPLDQTLEFAIQIADALDKAHRQGVVHRDLKPGNIMLTKSGAQLLRHIKRILVRCRRDVQRNNSGPEADISLLFL